MKKNLYISILSLLLVAVAGCQQDELAPAAGESREITLAIPQYPQGVGAGLVSAQHPQGQSLSGQTQGLPLHPAASTRAIAEVKTQWEEGDVLYISLHCYDGSTWLSATLCIAQRTAGGTWQYNKPLAVPLTTTRINIMATYTGSGVPGETLTGDVLYSSTLHNIVPDDNLAIGLPPFHHYHARITFTHLQEGDVVDFQGDSWFQSQVTDSYSLVYTIAPAPITADADGDAVLYAYITDADNCQFRILPGGVDDGTAPWYNFNPGEPNANGYYYNRTYTVDVEDMIAKGGNTAKGMEEEEERERERERAEARAPFLAWATGTGAGSWEEEDFTLTSDIDLTGVNWEPIGDDSYSFNHTFDGNGHTIRGLKVDKPDDSYIGLFGVIYGTVKNLTVEGSVTGSQCVGGITGMNHGIITGCTFRGTVTGNHTNDPYAGGIAGYTPGTITGCRVIGSTITGAGYVGGITGNLSDNSIGVIGCLVSNTQIGGTPGTFAYYGGIVGGNSSRLVACVSAATTTLTGTYLGSIAGRNYGTLSTCYWQTDIVGNTFTRPIGDDQNSDTPQESNCTGFTSGSFNAGYVAALNQAIEDSGVPFAWRFKESATPGGLPQLYVP